MGFSISTKHLPVLRTYAEALYRYENAEPVRGGDLRLLGNNRNSTHMTISKRDDGGIECVLYRTPCITYYPDRIMLNQGSWTTKSTAAFIHAVAPVRCSMRSGLLWLYVWGSPAHTQGWDTAIDGGKPVRGWLAMRDTVTLQEIAVDDFGCCDWVADHAVRLTKESVNRERVKPVRAALAEFVAYYHTMTRLEAVVTCDALRSLHDFTPKIARLIPEDFAKLFVFMRRRGWSVPKLREHLYSLEGVYDSRPLPLVRP